jgi:GTP-binding protein EngB required for normal cell division
MSLDRLTNNTERLAVSDGSRASGSRHGLDAPAVALEADNLLRIANLAEEFNNDQIRDDARSAAERVAEGRFYVACVGQFKRGKSTLLNALIGESVLPSGVIPVTAVPTILRFGERRQARVRLRSGKWTDIGVGDIEEYVSEAHNPENRKKVTALEVFVPSPLLREGMCFVDTPGLGSVFAGNTAATHAFLPHIDAAIVVIGADPPIAGDELSLVVSVAKEIPDILFVLNKADRVTEHERNAAVSFARRVLEERLQRPVRSIFEISALEQLDRGGSQRDWSHLVHSLEQLVQRSGQQLVRDAADRSLRRLSSQFFIVVNEERDALTRPFEESEKRIKQLREVVSHAEQSLNDLGFLFSGEQQRLSKTFGDRRDGFLKSVRASAHEQLDLALTSLPRTRGPSYRRSAMHAAQDVARSHTLPWLESEEKNAENAYCQITKRFTDLANDFLARARNLGSAEMAYLPKELESEQDFRTRSEFRFHEYIELASPASPVRYVADLILRIVFAYSVIAAESHEFLDRLLETNSERVRNDLENRVTESRRRLEAEIRGTLRELSAVAERALARARSAYTGGKAVVELSLKRLAAIEAELVRLSETSALGSS